LGDSIPDRIKTRMKNRLCLADDKAVAVMETRRPPLAAA
jgi:hypothetical protein